MKNVRICFSTSDDFADRAIRWFTRGRASHTFFLVDVDRWVLVIGADWNGVVVQSYRRFLESKSHNRVLTIYGSKELGFDLDQGLDFLMNKLNVGYDYLGLIGMGWVMVNKWFGCKIENPWGSPTRHFCSEVAGAMLKHIEFPDTDFLPDPGSLEPNVLWAFLDERALEVSLGHLGGSVAE